VLRINDRGPNVDDRELDVSFVAASRLGMLDRGLARVRIDLLEEPKRP
jgi:rare lipoprotein A